MCWARPSVEMDNNSLSQSDIAQNNKQNSAKHFPFCRNLRYDSILFLFDIFHKSNAVHQKLYTPTIFTDYFSDFQTFIFIIYVSLMIYNALQCARWPWWCPYHCLHLAQLHEFSDQIGYLFCNQFLNVFRRILKL